MHATAEDLPAGTGASGTVSASGFRDGGPVTTTTTTAAAAAEADAVREWVHERINLPDGQTPHTSHVGFLCVQRSITALEAAHAGIGDPQAASLFLAIADQYRQLANVCGERGGSAISPPRPPSRPGSHIR